MDTILMKITSSVIFGLFFLNILNGQQAGFRGPERSGIYNETGLMKSWPEKGPSLLWETSGIGTGYSSATVTDDAIYITGKIGGSEVLTSFTQDGKKNWELIYGSPSDATNFPEGRCTPSYSNGRIFVVSGQGDLVCAGKDGKLIWSVNYFRKYNALAALNGVSESPLVVDNKVIGTPGGYTASMVAFNAENGKVIWEAAPINEVTNYVNPLLIRNGANKIIVTWSAHHLLAVNALNGKLLWSMNCEELNSEQLERRNRVNTPVYRDGHILAAQGYDQVAIKLKINPDGTNPQIVWKNRDLDPHVGGIVLLGNLIFSSTHETNSKGKWICVDWMTGKTNWIYDWYNKGAIIAADGMLYIIEEKNGNVGLLKPDAEKFNLVSTFRMTKGSGPYFSHPVINKGRLFIRHGDYLAVYSIKAK
jgi:outer membrane protein assembly factor BamB